MPRHQLSTETGQLHIYWRAGNCLRAQCRCPVRLHWCGHITGHAPAGEKLASSATRSNTTPYCRRHWSPSIGTVTWKAPPGWRDVIVIVSYLFASPTLDVTTLVGELEVLLGKLGGGRVTVLYTNSVKQDANLNFPKFCGALQTIGFRLYADDTGSIEIKRRTTIRTRNLRYALFHRQRQYTLRLGG